MAETMAEPVYGAPATPAPVYTAPTVNLLSFLMHMIACPQV